MTRYIHCQYCKDIVGDFTVKVGSICKDNTLHTIDNRLGSGYPYTDNILGVDIENRGHKNKVMKEQGLVERG